jgi:hypothetical protein
MLKSLCLGVDVLFGVALGANGIFMLVAPENWYFAVPGVTSTGPFNQHFFREIGLIFLLLGGAFLVGAARPQVRVLLWAAPTILAFRPCPLPLLGGGRRYLLALRHRARLSSRHPAGDHRSGAYRLGNPECTLGNSRIHLSLRGLAVALSHRRALRRSGCVA